MGGARKERTLGFGKTALHAYLNCEESKRSTKMKDFFFKYIN
jgi:hypothetical protein